MSNTQRYSAFISYRHMPRDRQWAVRIMSELEAYRTPKALREQAFPERIEHLFRDEDEIPASNDLSDQIRDALTRSNYLIVVCSPDTPGSRWVRREIELFQEMGKGDRIIPLLIAGEPDDSFPPELRRRRVSSFKDDGSSEHIWEEVEPIAADVRPRADERKSKTEHRALLRLAAALLGCRFDDLARRDEERRKAQLRQQLGAAAALLSAACLGGLWWWDANLRIHTQYCAAYAEKWGAPECVGLLSEAQWKARQASYRFHIKAGRVLDMARVNSVDVPVSHPNAEFDEEAWTKGVAQWRFTYRSQARGQILASAVLEDKTGKRLRQIGYEFSADGRQAIARFDRNFGEAERQSAEGTSLSLAISDAGAVAKRSSIGQHRLHFDAQGRLLRRDFERVGGGAKAADAAGAFGRAYEYGENGLPNVIRNLDARGETLVEKTGIAGIRRAYDALGDITSIEWLDAKGNPAANLQGFARLILMRETNGNVVKESYVNVADTPILRRDRLFSIASNSYDERGNHIESAFFGTDGKSVLNKNGYAAVSIRYDMRGNVIEHIFLGTDRKLILRKEGYARAEAQYDENNNLIRVNFVGVDGKSVLNKDGFAHARAEYDNDKNKTRLSYFGIDGRPVLAISGYSQVVFRYDDRGNIIEESNLGVGSQLILDKENIARKTFGYDERGNLTSTEIFGTDGKLTLNKSGFARELIEYDKGLT